MALNGDRPRDSLKMKFPRGLGPLEQVSSLGRESKRLCPAVVVGNNLDPAICLHSFDVAYTKVKQALQRSIEEAKAAEKEDRDAS